MPMGLVLRTRTAGPFVPGAADDALGLAAMLEDARLFAAGPRPKRTVLFAAWTGEERGLLGSEYYAEHPIYPLETMAANLTFDTLQWNGPVKDAVLVGRGQSEMDEYFAQAAKAQGRYVTPENHPERGLFYRADHFSFARRGVPVLLDMALAGAYDMKNGGRAAGERWLDSFTSTCYHQTCDSWAPTWIFVAPHRKPNYSMQSERGSRTAMRGPSGIRRRNSLGYDSVRTRLEQERPALNRLGDVGDP